MHLCRDTSPLTKEVNNLRLSSEHSSVTQSSHEVLIDAKISLYVFGLLHHPISPCICTIFLSHETQSKKGNHPHSIAVLETLQLFGKVCHFTLKGSHQEVHRYLQRVSGVKMTTAGTEHRGPKQYHFFEDHHEVPKCLKLEAGKEQ